jgi:NADH-quinone oxidoreductase subunit N
LTIIALASILAGNLLALLQDNVKRILAYSSIAHLGYLLVAFLAAGALAIEAMTYYLVAYVVTMLGAFGVITLLSAGGAERDKDILEDYQGLFWRKPWLATAFTVMLLSLAGIPLTMGFIGKFYVVAAGVGASLWLLVSTLIIGSVISLFYYLRVIAIMCAPKSEEKYGLAARSAALFPMTGVVTLVALTAVLIGLGVYPAPLIQMLQATVTQIK